jgi:hypothetical protein
MKTKTCEVNNVYNINVNNIYDLIELMKQKPAMYMGDNKISTMRTFLDGYKFSSMVHNIKSEKVFPPFWYFHEWAKEKYNWFESTAGWKNIILEENNNDEEKALETFFAMIDEFRTLHPLSIEKLQLTKQNMDFHHSDKCQINYASGKPIYENADEVLLVKYSHDFGYSYFVTFQNKVQGLDWMDRYKDKKTLKESLYRLFGQLEHWQLLKGDLKSTLENIL